MNSEDTQNEALDRHSEWEVWLRWIGFTTLGYFIMGVLISGVPMLVPGGLALIPLTVGGGLVVVGFLQWLVLQHYIHNIRWWGWVLATVLGQLIGTIIAVIVVGLLGPLIYGLLGDSGETIGGPTVQLTIMLMTGCVLGTVIGFAQWLILRHHINRAAWWIPASAIAGAIIAVMPQILDAGLSGQVAVLINRAVNGVILGVITGVVLVWLLQESPTTAQLGDTDSA